MAADLQVGGQRPATSFDVQAAVDLGLDLALDTQPSFVIRTAVAMGDRQTLAAGLVLGGGAHTR